MKLSLWVHEAVTAASISHCYKDWEYVILITGSKGLQISNEIYLYSLFLSVLCCYSTITLADIDSNTVSISKVSENYDQKSYFGTTRFCEIWFVDNFDRNLNKTRMSKIKISHQHQTISNNFPTYETRNKSLYCFTNVSALSSPIQR